MRDPCFEAEPLPDTETVSVPAVSCMPVVAPRHGTGTIIVNVTVTTQKDTDYKHRLLPKQYARFNHMLITGVLDSNVHTSLSN